MPFHRKKEVFDREYFHYYFFDSNRCSQRSSCRYRCGEGLGGAVTGQSNFYNNSKKDGKDAFLKRLTIIIGIIFVVLVAVVDVLVARGIIK